MGETDRYIEYKDKYRQPGINFNINSPVMLLIIFNFTLFLFVQFLVFGKITGDTSVVPFFNERLHYFLAPTGFGTMLRQPWSIITYSFFHFSFLNIFSNMLWLFAFGSLLQSIIGNRKTFPIYIYGAVAGAIAFAIVSSAVNSIAGSFLFGASASVMAIAVAATTLAPNFKILQQIGTGIPIWILTAVYIFIDLVGIGRGVAPAFYASHIAGALTGFLFVVSYRKGYDWSVWMNTLYNKLIHLFEPGNKNKKTASVKERVFYNAGNRTPYQKTANITQQRVDEILDKISQKGYDYLTSEEKNILKRAAEEDL